MYNLEATPAEGHHLPLRQGRTASVIGHPAGGHRRRAVKLHQLVAAAVGFTDDAFEALERQDDLQRKYTGGTVLHLYMSEHISSAEACRNLVRRSLERFRLPYITRDPDLFDLPQTWLPRRRA